MISDPDLMQSALKSLWDGRPGVLILGLRQRGAKESEVWAALPGVVLIYLSSDEANLLTHLPSPPHSFIHPFMGRWPTMTI